MKVVKSDLKFLDYKLTNFEYTASTNEEENIEYEVTIETKLRKPKKISEPPIRGYLMRIDLELKIRGKVGKRVPIKVKCALSGIFSSEKLEEKEFVRLCATSGVANLIIVARSIIISFTSQTGNKPIIMPLINLLETYKKSIEKDKKE